MEAQNWAQLRTSIGDAGFVPAAIHHVLHAKTPEDAVAAYWELDNRVVLQGQLFDSAVRTSRELVRSICEGDYTEHGLPASLDLLVELAYGDSDQSELERGSAHLGARCRATIKEGLACIKSLIGHKNERVVMGVLDLVDRLGDDSSSRCAFLKTVPLPWWPGALRVRVLEMQPHTPTL